MLIFPDFSKPFLLTTDASDKAIGAVLSQTTEQGERPISFISKSLSKTEEDYATNEKELLAIVWALNSLRNFIYGAKIKIYTDHLPLTFAVSPKNSNKKIKRWKSFIEEHDYEMFYKQGKANVVADALSRIQLNSLTPTVHSSDHDDNSYIPSTESPINVFKNQLIFRIAPHSNYRLSILFGKYKHHIFSEPKFSADYLSIKLKEFLLPNTLNGIMTSEPIMGLIQEIYRETFNPQMIRARFSQKLVEDIYDENEQIKKINEIHSYAHRNAQENVAQLIKNCYFPGMRKQVKDFIKTCEICKTEKYDRHPQKNLPVRTPIPHYPSEIVHIDIFVFNQTTNFLSSIDKLSKFVKVKPIKSRSIAHIQKPLIELLYDWDVPSTIVIDNEKSFTSDVIEKQIKELGIHILKTPVHHSETNGQIERVHSTLREIIRCSRNCSPNLSINDIVQIAVHKYNNTIHSFINDTPKNIYTGVNTDNLSISDFAKKKKENLHRIIKKFKKKNENITEPMYPVYKENSFGFEKNNSISKREPKFKKVKIKENYPTHVIDEKGRKIHKSNLRK